MIATAVVGVPAVLLFLCVGGQYFPLVGFSIAGAMASTRIFAVALIALSVTAAAGVLLAWSPSAGGWLVLAAAVLAFLGAALNGVRQLRLARRENVFVSLASAIRRPQVDLTPDADEVYTTEGDQDLSLSVWRAVAPEGLAPVILMVHGGGWVAGDRNSGSTPRHARWFADRGYLVMGVDYSLSSEERHLWDVQEGQIAEAIRWAVRNAHRFGGDPRRIALVGESAGGNLVINVGSRIAAGEWVLESSGTPVVVSAISALYPATDLRAISDSPDLVLRKWLRSLVERYTGGSPDMYPERYDAVDSSTHIRSDTPPTLLAFGTRDHLVPPWTIRAYARRLRGAGVKVKTLEVPYSGHGFDEEGSIGCQVYREVTLNWFASHVEAFCGIRSESGR
ncbi:alpha/beta hydrolase [Nocardia sp. NPDC050713]|uniref:alpha/beta hydrolase n=1 Tax=Nocardia sp. NPDC050713 TaxID=3154511 RepID=UPI0033E916D5